MWDWRAGNGRIKDMACRTLLLKLEARGFLNLPPRRKESVNAYRNRQIPAVSYASDAICCPLKALLPLEIKLVQGQEHMQLFSALLKCHHYLGYSGAVGENLKYLVEDQAGRPMACLLFGSAAWKLAARDRFLGWDDTSRNRNLPLITNNMRFLILPWVKVEHLASHILGRIARRISDDWLQQYGHEVVLLETFVDTLRFQGTCYRAANWLHVGRSTGRTRNGKGGIQAAPKEIYLYPLHRRYLSILER